MKRRAQHPHSRNITVSGTVFSIAIIPKALSGIYYAAASLNLSSPLSGPLWRTA